MSDSVIDLSPVAGVDALDALDALVPGRSLPLGLLEPPDMWLDFADGAVVLRLTAWVEPATASADEVEPPNGVYVTLDNMFTSESGAMPMPLYPRLIHYSRIES